MAVDLVVGGEVRRDEVGAESLDRRCLQSGAGRCGDGEVGVGLHTSQSGRTEQAWQASTVGRIDTAFGEQGADGLAEPVGELMLGVGLLQAGQGLEGGVGVLDQEPSDRKSVV